MSRNSMVVIRDKEGNRIEPHRRPLEMWPFHLCLLWLEKVVDEMSIFGVTVEATFQPFLLVRAVGCDWLSTVD
ncbi:unnamed protein product [Prunus armeniaca]|uniref:Uncharacterized protein n=1 Tax=Prunus armeniaca TaxID=36596 RepID=A0A6J5UJI4_PRUAR|nr:unnamed protein product [Prunus armeniaca]